MRMRKHVTTPIFGTFSKTMMATSHTRAESVTLSQWIGEVAAISAGIFASFWEKCVELLQVVVKYWAWSAISLEEGGRNVPCIPHPWICPWHIRGESCVWAESTCIIMHSGHGQWAWLRWPTEMHYLWCLWAMRLDSKHPEANLLPTSTNLLYLQISQVPRSQDLAILWMTTGTQPITSWACVRCNWRTQYW